jgi:hypothetical protein
MNHLDAALTHIDKALDDVPLCREVARELRQLGDRHALIADALDVNRRVEERENEAQIGGHRGLTCQDQLNLGLDRHVPVVDLVIEGDDLVAQLDVLRAESIDCTANGAQDDLTRLLEARLEAVQVGLQLGPHPKRPVT